jgi:dTDP-4-dehydrorhamnose 3,5-epimerase
MRVVETKLKGCYLIEPKIFNDDRGYFFEAFNRNKFCEAIGEQVNFVQDNQSFSKKGVVRALHYQLDDFAQAKLVRVLHGAVLDVAVDLRKGSDTFGEHVAVELSSENRKQLFIPRGFGHGFAVLSDTAEFFYKCDNYYHAPSEGGIYYNDPRLKIDWKLPESEVILSDKDAGLPLLRNARL